MDEFSLEALKDEIVADSEALGYKNSATANDWKEDQEIADLINAKNFTVTRSRVDAEELSQAITKDAFLALAPSETDWLRWVTNSQTIVVTTDLVDALYGTGTIFGGAPGAATRAALQAVIEVPGSRAEVLWGVNTTISLGQIGRAFNEI